MIRPSPGNASVPAQVVDSGVTGILVDPVFNETDAWATDADRKLLVGDASAARHAAAVIALARDPRRMREMGAAARSVVARTWSTARFFDRHAALLEAGRRPPAAAVATPFDALKFSRVRATWTVTKFKSVFSGSSLTSR